MRTVGVEEELLVVDPVGHPVPLGPEALTVASRRGEGEEPLEHDRAQGDGRVLEGSRIHLVPELKEQQLELGTSIYRNLEEVSSELQFWRGRARAAAEAVGAHGTGADLKRRVHHDTGGDLAAVVRAAVEITAAQASAGSTG